MTAALGAELEGALRARREYEAACAGFAGIFEAARGARREAARRAWEERAAKEAIFVGGGGERERANSTFS